MSTLIKRLLLCFVLILFSAQDAHAGRFGLQTGLYKDRLGNRNSCAGSSEVGLRLGFYADKTAHDLIYASAMNGFDLCQVLGTCPGNGNLAPRVAPPCLCSASTPTCCQPMAPIGCGSAPVGCGSAALPPAPPAYQQQQQPQMVMQAPQNPNYYPQSGATIAPTISVVQQPAAAPVQQATPKTEVYLLVMPNQQQQPASYQQPMSYQAPQQPSYYREPISYGGTETQQPVRGLW